jgi:phosphatidylinositol glycan class W
MDAAAAAAASIKQQKEAFVTGHEGTTPWEVLLVCLSAPIGLACCQLVGVKTNQYQSFLVEALIMWFPMILCQSNYLYPWGVLLLSIQGGVLVLLLLQKKMNATPSSSDDSPPKQAQAQPQGQPPQRLDYLTAYRSSILYLTFIAILAVDFHVFPRRFAKTEVSGYGLMDVGAASFCMSAGLVSPKARGKLLASTSNFRKQVWHTLPLVVLGILRILTNKGLEYQEHVSEYGVHWNFFFTMGVLVAVPQFIAKTPPYWILPVAVLILYQLSLSLGLQTFIETAPRTCKVDNNVLCNVVVANREGILGSIGYLALYFFGEWVGAVYLWKPAQPSQSLQPQPSLWKLAAGLWILLWAVTQLLGLPVSRRSTNAPFCLWAAAHNVLLLTCFKEVTTTVSSSSSSSHILPTVLERVNRHGLLLFLIANLLTGLVNLTVPTLEVSDPWALLIVFGYICTVGIAALLLDHVLHQRLFGGDRDQNEKVKTN